MANIILTNLKRRCRLLLLIIAVAAAPGCKKEIPAGFMGSGTLEATEVRISALIMGTILELPKEEGDLVAPDEMLAQIDVEKLSLQRNQVQAGFKEIDAGEIAADAAIVQAEEHYENIKKKHDRIQALFKAGSTTRQRLDDITTQLETARSRLTSARSQKPLLAARREKLRASIALIDRQIADGTVLSPTNGVVLEKYAEPGEVVTPGGGLYKIGDLDRFWLKIFMAETDLDEAVLGRPVLVRVDALDDPLAGKIAWVSPEAEFTPKNVQTKQTRAELVYAVKVTVDDPVPALKIGMPAEVYQKNRSTGEGESGKSGDQGAE